MEKIKEEEETSQFFIINDNSENEDSGEEEDKIEEDENEEKFEKIVDKKRELLGDITYALLILPGKDSEETIKEIMIDNTKSENNNNKRLKQMQELIGGYIEKAPRLLKKVYFDDDYIYNYELWVDEEGGPYCKDLDYNGCATISLHPHAEISNEGCFRLHGPAIMIRTGKDKNKGLFIEDWKRISRATYYDSKLVTKNLEINKL